MSKFNFSSYKKHLLVFFNPANIFLVFITFLVLTYSWLNIYGQSSLDLNTKDKINQVKLFEKENLQNYKIRVLDKEIANFGKTRYFVWSEKSVWQLETTENLEIGKQYWLEGRKVKFFNCLEEKLQKNLECNSYEVYSRSLGILGKILVQKFTFKNKICDLICKLWQSIEKTRRYIKQVYYKHICVFVKDLAEFSSLKCQNVYALSVGLTLGGTADFDKQTKIDLQNLGLTHLVAVSGFQVVLLVSSLEFLALKLKFSKKYRFILILLGIFLMVVLVGLEPPVLRSSLSIIISLIALQLGRKIDNWRALIYSQIVLLLLNPWYLISISFQLSFLASLGLIVSNKVQNLTKFWWKKANLKFSFFLELFISTLASFTFTLPIIINLNEKISLFTIFTNLLVVPVIPYITYLNLLGLIPWIGQVFLLVATIIQTLILTIVTDLAKIAPSLYLTKFNILETLIYYIGLVFLWQLPKKIDNTKL